MFFGYDHADKTLFLRNIEAGCDSVFQNVADDGAKVNAFNVECFGKNHFQICPDLADLCFSQVVVQQCVHSVFITEVGCILCREHIPVTIQVFINRRIVLFHG